MWPFSYKQNSGVCTRGDRTKCWEARDQYFACLDNAGVLKPEDEKASGSCSLEIKSYEQNCARSWIEYFNQRRVIAQAQKDRLMQANTQAEDSKR